MAKDLYVGIDLGTTNSTAAVFDGEHTELVRNAQASPLTPSVVRIDARGDVTVGARARKYLETDPDIHEADSQASWEDLDERVRDHAANAASWVSEYGTAEEQTLFKDALGAIERARGARDARELQRQLRLISNLLNAAYYRHPEAVAWDFEYVASKVAEATNLPQAEELVRQGHAALDRNDKLALKGIVDRLWSLMPPSVEQRRRGFDSGLR